MTPLSPHAQHLRLVCCALTVPLLLSACGDDNDLPPEFPCGDTFIPACTPGGERLSCEDGTLQTRACAAGTTCGMGLCCPTVANARVLNENGSCAYTCEPGTTNQGTAAQPNCVVSECTVDACHGGQLMRCDPASHHFLAPAACPDDQLCAPGATAAAAAACAPRDDFVLTTTWVLGTSGLGVLVRDPDPSVPPSRFDLDCDGDGKYERTDLPAGSYVCEGAPASTVRVSLRGYIQRLNWGDSPVLGYATPITLLEMEHVGVNTEDFPQLVEINAWGKNPWRSTEEMFAGSFYLFKLSAQDAPNLSQVTSVAKMFAGPQMGGMFKVAPAPTWDLRSWDVSRLTTARELFSRLQANVDTRGWDTSNIIDMYGMFTGCKYTVLADWDTPKVQNMSHMFQGFSGRLLSSPSATDFAGNSWNVANVTDMAYMFQNSALTPDLSKWTVSNVTNMSHMFDNASFNSDVSGWKVSKVTDMSAMFRKSPFAGDLTEWDVSNVTNMSAMFEEASDFNGKMSKWEVSKVTDMSYMFDKASKFNQDISKWVVSNLEDMSGMFYGASVFNADISGWKTTNVKSMSALFADAEAFNQDISGWKTSKVTDMGSMFRGAEVFNQDLKGWDVSQVTNMRSMFSNATNFNGDISDWKTTKVTNMSFMFSGATNFNGDLSKWNTSSVTTMYSMFKRAASFTGGNLNGWDVSSVTSMTSMFDGATYFDGKISDWVVSHVRSMAYMFKDAQSFTGDLSKWDVSAVTWTDDFNKGANNTMTPPDFSKP